ncbi:MAG: DNA repair protein RecN [Clostridia bacterium]|nr:DNA repair protein RecN [Clostridia bacterium]
MLTELTIQNIAVIERAELSFDRGLNVLTGETGAGKSIVIDAINAVLGERTSRELIRTGAASAKVTALFTAVSPQILALLDAHEIDQSPDGSVLITRTLQASGHSSCRINGCPVTAAQLREIGGGLINIHGQQDGQALLQPERHCGYLDALAGNEALREEYKTAFHALIGVKKELDALYDSRDDKAARLDYLNYVIEEIEQARVQPGERDALTREKALLSNSGKVVKALQNACAALAEDRGLIAGAQDCAAAMEQAAQFYDDAKPTAEKMRGLAFELGDCLADARRLADSVVYDPARLNEISERLDQLFRLSAKYGGDEDAILQTLNDAVAERGKLEVSDARIAQLEQQLYALSDQVKTLAAKLTDSRMTTAGRFETAVMEELRFLDMPKVSFVVQRREAPLSSRGGDAIEFLISANPGQTPRPIAKIASGGELSRIMLAIKNVLADADPVATLIFDEIDTGVSGSAAEKIARKLEQLSNGRQIICVTHLGRIAAQADRHMLITKNVTDTATYTEITVLDTEGRAREIARIHAGEGVTQLQIDSARELLLQAEREKEQI